MITHIRMKNFKSWQESPEVRLAPLTGFFGTNSSGKSSLLQMLLLLKQTAERSDPNEVIFFGDENSPVNLGDFSEVIHGHQLSSALYLKIKCKLNHSFALLTTPPQITHFAFDTVIRENNGNPILERFRYRNLFSDTKIAWKDNKLFIDDQSSILIHIQNCYGQSSKESDISKILTLFSSAFEELFSHVYYLGPVRARPRRHYHWDGSHPEDIGRWGYKAIDALLSARVNKLTIQREEQVVPVEVQISEWLREMDLAHSFSLERTDTRGGKNYDVRIQKSEHGAKVTLADMGFGLSQFLPVLVLCYYAPEGSTLILEQPGIHLHPKVQSELADLLIEVITKRNLQILIESHSEHLLNRLQRRVAEEKIAADQTALYFCQHTDGVSKIDKLDMDELGNITNWPENFFGDEMGDLFAMTEAQRERQKRTEG
ncbi:DUF3696 domain-containing protein [Candidatus Poribacteria bacterium]|nr:DUF3696 domain-containing protein [Candidatus Poribacteria bacterium]